MDDEYWAELYDTSTVFVRTANQPTRQVKNRFFAQEEVDADLATANGHDDYYSDDHCSPCFDDHSPRGLIGYDEEGEEVWETSDNDALSDDDSDSDDSALYEESRQQWEASLALINLWWVPIWERIHAQFSYERNNENAISLSHTLVKALNEPKYQDSFPHEARDVLDEILHFNPAACYSVHGKDKTLLLSRSLGNKQLAEYLRLQIIKQCLPPERTTPFPVARRRTVKTHARAHKRAMVKNAKLRKRVIMDHAWDLGIFQLWSQKEENFPNTLVCECTPLFLACAGRSPAPEVVKFLAQKSPSSIWTRGYYTCKQKKSSARSNRKLHLLDPLLVLANNDANVGCMLELMLLEPRLLLRANQCALLDDDEEDEHVDWCRMAGALDTKRSHSLFTSLKCDDNINNLLAPKRPKDASQPKTRTQPPAEDCKPSEQLVVPMSQDVDDQDAEKATHFRSSSKSQARDLESKQATNWIPVARPLSKNTKVLSTVNAQPSTRDSQCQSPPPPSILFPSQAHYNKHLTTNNSSSAPPKRGTSAAIPPKMQQPRLPKRKKGPRQSSILSSFKRGSDAVASHHCPTKVSGRRPTASCKRSVPSTSSSLYANSAIKKRKGGLRQPRLSF